MSKPAALLLIVAACHPSPSPTPAPAPAPMPAISVISCQDLPADDPRSHNLSALAWDAAAHRLYSISDRDRQIIVLAPDASLTHVELLPPIPLDVPIADWDAEGLVLAGDRFLLVANETQPAIFSVDRTGHDATPVALPAFPGIRKNLGLESLGYLEAHGARYLFTANEQALDGDGPISTLQAGTTIRILRHALTGGADLEVAYRTEPVFAAGGPHHDNGVSDLVPLAPDRLLVVERGWVEGVGNAVRIFDVSLHDAASALAVADARTVAPAAKRLVVDLSTLPADRCAAGHSPQPNAILENYEGIALGPVLADGRQVLFLLADDNGGKHQVARLLTLAVPPGAL